MRAVAQLRRVVEALMAMLAKEYAAVRIMTPPSCAVAVARDRISAGTGQGGGASHHAARRRRREAFVWGGGQYRKGRQASIDRAARYPCRPRHHAHAAISGRPRLRGAEQPPASFVEARAQRFETAANRCLVNHALGIDCAAETGNPPHHLQRRSAPAPVDSLILRRRLSQLEGALLLART